MNWFQIVFLREQSQDSLSLLKNQTSCELVSNCIFTWAITSSFSSNVPVTSLWIGFKLYFYVSNHKLLSVIFYPVVVVNWFQIVFLREQSQDCLVDINLKVGCELVSNCIFTWAITRGQSLVKTINRLWIGFKLYFYVSNHK